MKESNAIMLVDLTLPENIVGLYCLVQLGLVFLGFYCASLLSSRNPFWARLVLLIPSLTGLASIAFTLQHYHEPEIFDVLSAVSVLALYLLIVFGRGWLSLERKTNPDGTSYDRRMFCERRSVRKGGGRRSE
jgi:hypothetical protein